MNTSLEQGTVHTKGSMQSRMSHCLFGDWPRREMLKLSRPVIDRPVSLQDSKESMCTDMKAR
ncbi:MAG: hypothetical protein NPIRA03_11260 [Nitrospirales bacterium]|nr:MAG: hypothetical protein NPIRA03_11260 [Nitrospirales bacterium]